MSTYDYDIIVIGGGAGGLMSAKVAQGLGKKVAIVEKNKLGGECTWTGCVPSKTIIKSAQVAHHIAHSSEFGIGTQGNFNTSKLMDYVGSVVQEIYATHTPEKLAELGIDTHFGNAQFVDEHTIGVNDATITAKKFIIATGSRPFVPPIEGLDTVNFLTNESLFNLKELPSSMLILGGGAIGCEMASALNRLGVQVTMIEMQDRLLVHDDREVVKLLSRHMKREGVTIRTSMKAEKVAQAEDGIVVSCVDQQEGVSEILQAQALLVAVGRRPNIKELGLDRAGVLTSAKGITVNNKLQTSAKHIYACGDVVGPYLFSHMAGQQAIIAARNACLPLSKKMSYAHVLWVTFSAPELATAGLTEEQAREKYGDKIDIYRVEYNKLDRAHNDHALTGMAKFICDKRGRLIGTHILGVRAGEVIHEAQAGMARGMRLTDFYSIIHAYPTYSEIIWHGAKQAYIDRLQRNIFVRLLKWIVGNIK